MSKPLTPIQKIDEVLEIVTSKTTVGGEDQYLPKSGDEIRLKIQSIDNSVSADDFLIVLKQLLKDGHIDYPENEEKQFASQWHQCKYYKTLKGEIYIAGGGYQGEINRQNAESIRAAKLETIQMANQRWMIWLTAILAVGTTLAAIYYCVELYWNHGWFHF